MAAVFVVIGVCHRHPQPINDNSFFTHLATGRLILEQGDPDADPYSFTARRRAVGRPELARRLGLYGVARRVDGRRAAYARSVAVLGGAVAGIVWRLARPARGLVARLGIGSWASGRRRHVVRSGPLVIGLLLLATLLVVERRLRDRRWPSR